MPLKTKKFRPIGRGLTAETAMAEMKEFLQQTIGHYELSHPEKDWCFLMTRVWKRDKPAPGGVKHIAHPCHSLNDALATVRRLSIKENAGYDVYVCVAILKRAEDPSDQRRRKEDVKHCILIPADLDVYKGMSSLDIERRLQSSPLPPSIVVETGPEACFQGSWVLEEPTTDSARAVAVGKRIRRYYEAKDDVSDTTRLMRPPGFVNQKEKYKDRPPFTSKIRKDLCATGRKYTLDELEAAFPPSTNEIVSEGAAAGQLPVASETSSREITSTDMPGWLESALGQNPAAKSAFYRTSDESRDDASAADYGLCAALLSIDPELSNSKLAIAMRACREHHSANPMKANRVDYVERTVKAVREALQASAGPLMEDWLQHIRVLDQRFGQGEGIKWLVESIIHIGKLVIMAGPPKAFKSTICLHLAVCVASGKPLFGKFAVGSTGPVVLVSQEDGPDLVVTRLRGIAKAYGLDLTKLPIHVACQSDFRLDDAKCMARLEAQARELGAKLVVIDNLRAAFAGNENDSAEVRKLMNAARHICTRVGCGLVLVHHFRKQGGAYGDSSNRLRGSTDLYASVDSLVTVETRGVRKVKVSGQHRAAPPTDAMWFMATDVEGSVCFEQTTKTPHSEEQQILAAVLDGGPAGLTKTQAIKGASIKQEVGSAAFDALVSKGQLKPAPGQGKKVRGVRYCAVDIGDEVDELCAELAESQDPSEELE